MTIEQFLDEFEEYYIEKLEKGDEVFGAIRLDPETIILTDLPLPNTFDRRVLKRKSNGVE